MELDKGIVGVAVCITSGNKTLCLSNLQHLYYFSILLVSKHKFIFGKFGFEAIGSRGAGYAAGVIIGKQLGKKNYERAYIESKKILMLGVGGGGNAAVPVIANTVSKRPAYRKVREK